MVVPLGGAVLNKRIGKTPNVPSPSAATEVGLEVLELGFGKFKPFSSGLESSVQQVIQNGCKQGEPLKQVKVFAAKLVTQDSPAESLHCRALSNMRVNSLR